MAQSIDLLLMTCMQGATDTDAAHTITALRHLPQSRDISTNRQLQSRGAMQFSSSADAKEQQRAEMTGHAASLHTPPGSAAKRGLQVFTRQHLPTTKRLFAHATAEMQQAWAPGTRVSNSAWPAADARSAHVSRLRHSTGELLTVEVSSSCMLYSDEQAWNATPGTSSLMKYLQGHFCSAQRCCCKMRASQVRGPGATWVQVFPRSTSKIPGLLERVQRTLADGKRRVRALATAHPITATVPELSANVNLDAHRASLDTFISGFPTYAALLSTIKQQLDAFLDASVACGRENVQLREQLAQCQRESSRAVLDAQKQVRCIQAPCSGSHALLACPCQHAIDCSVAQHYCVLR